MNLMSALFTFRVLDQPERRKTLPQNQLQKLLQAHTYIKVHLKREKKNEIRTVAGGREGNSVSQYRIRTGAPVSCPTGVKSGTAARGSLCL